MKPFYNSSLPKNYKILKSLDYSKLLRSGSRVILDDFNVIYKKNGLGHPRFGYIVGKKISKKSVTRNRVKRLFREVFRQNKSLFDSNDIIFFATGDISGKSANEISRELFSKADLS